MSNLGGPREGNCTSRSFLLLENGAVRDEQQHGTRPWAEFIADMEKAGATRPTFDLFDVPEGGLTRRYRVVSEGMIP